MLIGAPGNVINTAPLPPVDSNETPIELIAVTLAKILYPQARLYGAAISTETGIEHDWLRTMLLELPLQYREFSV